MTEDRELWRVAEGARLIVCVMRTCCSGAELQVIADDKVVLQELYPSKSDLYERARELGLAHRHVYIP
jgi:hypothetical protein